jgi:hypothetical protein
MYAQFISLISVNIYTSLLADQSHEIIAKKSMWTCQKQLRNSSKSKIEGLRNYFKILTRVG